MKDENVLSPNQTLDIEEYRSLIQLINYEGTLFWDRFSAHFAIDAALLATTGLVVSLSNPSAISNIGLFVSIISVSGFLANLVWFFNSRRAHVYYKYWIDRAKEIENDKEFGEHLKTFTKMSQYFDRLTMRDFFKRVPIVSAASIIPVAFMLAFVAVPFAFPVSNDLRIGGVLVDALSFLLFSGWGLQQYRAYRRRAK